MVIPIMITLAIYIYNFINYSAICSYYMIINAITLILIILVFGIGIMKSSIGIKVANIFFVALIGLMNLGILSATPYTKCYTKDSFGQEIPLVTFTTITLDCIFNLIFIMITITFISIYTRKDIRDYAYRLESWFYQLLLSESGRNYLRY
jgi:hypothetical protein